MSASSAIVMTSTGGPEVLEWVGVDIAEPGEGQVAVEMHAAGVNFIDTYHRTGLYPVELPFRPGLEGAGIVTAVGEGVSDLAVGQSVAWGSAQSGYGHHAVLPAAQVVPVPDGVDPESAAAVLLQGMTAHYLAFDTYSLQPGDKCLVHAGAGGVGLLLIQIAKRLGAEVFTTVGTPEKAELAKGAGADHTILYRDVDFGDEVERIAGSRALDVVYDGVGKSVFSRSLDLLRPRGVMATFGNASGPVDPVSPLQLMPSLFLTRPTLFDYIRNRDELLARTGDLFGWMKAGELDVRIGLRLPMTEAAEAHRKLEGRETTGKIVLHR